MSEFGDAFKEARIKSNRTFRQIKEKIGMSIGFWSELENGKQNPPDIPKIEEAERFFGITDGRLVRLAKREKSKIPSAIGRLIEGKPQLGEVLFRLDDLPPDELESLLQSLRDNSRDGDNEPFFLDWNSMRHFDKEVVPF